MPLIAARLSANGIEIRGCRAKILPEAVAATPEDWSAEYLGPTISVAIVDSLEQAATHINQHGSHHTDAIITENLNSANTFTTLVDNSAVMVNAAHDSMTAVYLPEPDWNSTDKFHARGQRTPRTDHLQVHRSGTGQIRQ